MHRNTIFRRAECGPAHLEHSTTRAVTGGGGSPSLPQLSVPLAGVPDFWASAILEIQGGAELTTVPDVQIIKTGIEYPLASGPATFTPEDLAAAVDAQNDAGIPQPRIWLGHFDDERIHGERLGAYPSGEPAVGKVIDMRLTEDGHCIVGDLTGVPLWLANIMSSAFPSRSVEGRFNVQTVTGKEYRLVISSLALLGVCWPGVQTLDDIAALYTKEGPKISLVEATPDQPVTITAALDRVVEAQVTVEDIRREWYKSTEVDPLKRAWWLRSIYIEPNELIVDADDGGTLYRQPFTVLKSKIKFGKLKKVKIQYVNASHGGVEAKPVNEARTLVAQFQERPEQEGHALTVNVSAKSEPGSSIEVKLQEGS